MFMMCVLEGSIPLRKQTQQKIKVFKSANNLGRKTFSLKESQKFKFCSIYLSGPLNHFQNRSLNDKQKAKQCKIPH